MPLGPVVASSRLSKDKVVRPEDGSIGSGTDGVHGARLEVEEDGSGHILATAGLIVVHIDALQLEVRGSSIIAIGLDAVLIRDDLPELKLET